MTDEHGETPDPSGQAGDGTTDLDDELADIRSELEAFEEEIDDRTVHRDEIEPDEEEAGSEIQHPRADGGDEWPPTPVFVVLPVVVFLGMTASGVQPTGHYPKVWTRWLNN